jgi:hypothetical protein
LNEREAGNVDITNVKDDKGFSVEAGWMTVQYQYN